MKFNLNDFTKNIICLNSITDIVDDGGFIQITDKLSFDMELFSMILIKEK